MKYVINTLDDKFVLKAAFLKVKKDIMISNNIKKKPSKEIGKSNEFHYCQNADFYFQI